MTINTQGQLPQDKAVRRPRHWATAFGRGPHGGAGAFGWAGCRPHRGGRAGATGCARGAPRSRQGVSLIEVLVSVVLISGGVLASSAVVSRDLSFLTRNRVDNVARRALLQRIEERRRQPFTTIFGVGQVPVGTCRTFHAEPAYAALDGLPFGEGRECAEAFETGAGSRRNHLTITTRAFDGAVTGPNDPRIREFRATLIIYADGVNRQ